MPHAPCPTRHAPRATRHAPRATPHAPRATRHAKRPTPRNQILRVVLRYGFSVHAFPWYVVLWAACFFGMVSAPVPSRAR